MPKQNPIIANLKDLYGDLVVGKQPQSQFYWVNQDALKSLFEQAEGLNSTEKEEFFEVVHKIIDNQFVRIRKGMEAVLTNPLFPSVDDSPSIDDVLDFSAYLLELENKRVGQKRISIMCSNVAELMDLDKTALKHFKFEEPLAMFKEVLEEFPYFEKNMEMLKSQGIESLKSYLVELLDGAHQEMKSLNTRFVQGEGLSQVIDILHKKYGDAYGKNLMTYCIHQRQESFYQWFEPLRNQELHTKRDRNKYNSQRNKIAKAS